MNNKLLTREEYNIWLARLPKDLCAFCEWGEYQVLLKEFEYWIWIACIAPYWQWHTLIVPKRHFIEPEEQTFKEVGERVFVESYVKKRLLDADLKREDGTPVEKIVVFYRFRANRYDQISNTIRPDHFHLHVTPDKDHLWDSTLDKNAYLCPVQELLKE
jgi:hypothetical protein